MAGALAAAAAGFGNAYASHPRPGSFLAQTGPGPSAPAPHTSAISALQASGSLNSQFASEAKALASLTGQTPALASDGGIPFGLAAHLLDNQEWVKRAGQQQSGPDASAESLAVLLKEVSGLEEQVRGKRGCAGCAAAAAEKSDRERA
jgi:hypothetical protein